MPFDSITRRIARAWRFVDRFSQGEAAMRQDLDIAMGDVEASVNGAINYLEIGLTNTIDFTGISEARAKSILTGIRTDLPFATPLQYGGVGDGVADDTAAITAIEATDRTYVNLGGRTWRTTLQWNTLTKKYWNGRMIVRNSLGNDEDLRLQAPFFSDEPRLTGRKSPVLSWAGKNVLWLGTSIPQFPYPQMIAEDLSFTVDNNAWAGSRAAMFPIADTDPDGSINQIKQLSMTDADRAAGLALHGAGSVYDDAYDVVTLASQMTCDYRIAAPWQSGHFDVVVLDHNHNDRQNPWGTLDPTSYTVTGLTKGATTTLTVSGTHGLVVGDGVGLRVTGIDALDYAAGRVQSVAGATVVVAIESAALAGTFTSGSLVKFDRATVYGAFQFLVYFIKNCALRYGTGTTEIILCSAPSEFTNDAPANGISSVSKAIRNVADKWGLAFYDLAQDLRIGAADHLIYMPDAVHPTTTETQRVIANHWVRWLVGGASPIVKPTSYVPNAGADFVDQGPAVYSALRGGFVPATRFLAAASSVLSDDFSGTLAAYTLVGTAPVIEAAPWDAGAFAVKCVSTVGTPTSYLERAVSTDVGVIAEFDIYMATVAGLASGVPKTINLMALRTTGAYLVVQLIVSAGGVQPRVIYFQEPNNGVVNFAAAPVFLQAATKHTIRLESLRDDGNSTGGLALYFDDVLVSGPFPTTDSAQANPSLLRFGPQSNNTGSTVTVWLGNLAIQKRGAVAAVSGSFTAGAATVTVTNGLITGIA